MNALTGLTNDSSGRSSEPEGGARQFTLRRSGHKAVRFTGWRTVEALGGGETGKMWYDLALYGNEAGGFVVELIARRRLLDEQDLCRVEMFDNLAAASTWLEAYVCANDVPVPQGLAAGEGPMACSVLQAVQLRQTIVRITDDYQSLLSDVFEVLELTDPTNAGIEKAL